MARRLPYNIAHQGASKLFPPNTLAAFSAAMEAGADWIELDVVTSRDGIVIVSHDTTVDRCTDGRGRILDLMLAEIKALDAGIRFGAQFRGERMPTLEEAIELVRDTNTRLCIEIKADSDAEYRRTAFVTVDVLQRFDYLRPAVITSFGPECVRAIKALEPRLSVALDPDKQDGSRTPWELCQQVLGCGANFMLHDHRALTAELVDEAHEHGFALWAWTTDDPDKMRGIIEMEADGIMTNRPDVLAGVLGR